MDEPNPLLTSDSRKALGKRAQLPVTRSKVGRLSVRHSPSILFHWPCRPWTTNSTQWEGRKGP